MSTAEIREVERVKEIPLRLITVSHNPRDPIPTLQEKGFVPIRLLQDYAISPDPAKRQHYVELMEEFEPEIVGLCNSICEGIQIEPVILRDFRVQVGDEYKTRFGIAAGERRVLAWGLYQARTGKIAFVRAIVRKLTVEQAWFLGFEENLHRKAPGDLKLGEGFHLYSQQHTLVSYQENGETKHKIVPRDKPDEQDPLPLTEVARRFHQKYHFVRERVALATQLPPERLALYKSGQLNLSDAIKEALKEPGHRSKPSRKGTRRLPLRMSQLEALFDATPKNMDDAVTAMRLSTLAECMKLELPVALAESEERQRTDTGDNDQCAADDNNEPEVSPNGHEQEPSANGEVVGADIQF